MTLTDFFQSNQEQRQESDKTLFDAPVYEMNDPNNPFIAGLIGNALTASSFSVSARDRLTDLESRIDNIESRITGIEADAIVDIMARLATINERLGTLEGRR
jgi:hypothetical protein